MSASEGVAGTAFSDLLEVLPDGTPRVFANVHHLQELLQMDAEEVLDRFKRDQVEDFRKVIRELEDVNNPLYQEFSALKELAEKDPGNPFTKTALFNPRELERFFPGFHVEMFAPGIKSCSQLPCFNDCL